MTLTMLKAESSNSYFVLNYLDSAEIAGLCNAVGACLTANPFLSSIPYSDIVIRVTALGNFPILNVKFCFRVF